MLYIRASAEHCRSTRCCLLPWCPPCAPAGCECTPTTVDCHQNLKESQLVIHSLTATQSALCFFSVSILNQSSSGEHKVGRSCDSLHVVCVLNLHPEPLHLRRRQGGFIQVARASPVASACPALTSYVVPPVELVLVIMLLTKQCCSDRDTGTMSSSTQHRNRTCRKHLKRVKQGRSVASW